MASLPLNWQRHYRIRFGVPIIDTSAYYTQGSFLPNNPSKANATQNIPNKAYMISNIPEDGHALRGFDFSLSTKRVLGSNSVSSEVSTLSIKNINPSMYDLFNTQGCIVVIEAGYRDRGVDVIYKGFVQRVDVGNSGNDVVYTVQMKDAGIDTKSTKVSVDYPETANAEDVLKSLVKFFPSVATSKITLGNLKDTYINGGFSFEGKLIDNIEKFCKTYKIDYSFFNGNFIAINRDVIIGDPTFKKLEPNTYVFKARDIKAIDKVVDNTNKSVTDKDTKSDVMMTSFLNPISFENFFTIPVDVSTEFSGTYKVKTIETTLNSRSTQWDTTLIGSPI